MVRLRAQRREGGYPLWVLSASADTLLVILLLLLSSGSLTPSCAVDAGSCQSGNCPAPMGEMGWADTDDATEMEVHEIVAEFEGHISRLGARRKAGKLSMDEYKAAKKKARKHYRNLLVFKGADQSMLDKVKAGGSKSKSQSSETKSQGQAPKPVANKVAKASGTTCVYEAGVDYPGGQCSEAGCTGSDIRFIRNVSDAGACCRLCHKEDECVYWTYASAEVGVKGQRQVCWLKTAQARASRRSGVRHGAAMMSGYVSGRVENQGNQGEGKGPTAESQAASEVSKDSRQESMPSNVSPESAQRAEDLANKAHSLFGKGIVDESMQLFKEAISLNPDSGRARLRYALLLERSGKAKESADMYAKALAATNPKLAGREKMVAENNLGLMYKDHLRRPDLAEKVFRKSIEDLEAAGVNNFHYPYKNFGQMLEKNSRTEEAMGLLRKAAEIKRDDGLKIYSELLLPYVYDDEADMKAWRDQFKANVGKLMKTKLHVPDPISMDGVPHYYLSYHGKNDAKINARLARMFRKAAPSVNHVAPHIQNYNPPAEGKKIKVGFISYYFREHSVLKMIAGLLREIDKSRFEVVLFNMGNIDSKTSILESFASRHVPIANLNFEAMKTKLSEEKLDVAVYAEIGMDPHSYALALGRQAPVQIAMHGHASTTGISTLDYFVTYEGFSEPDAQSHYSEALIQLPGQTPLTLYYDIVPFKLPAWMETAEGIAKWRRKFKIPVDKTVYACTQTLFKVDPKLDWVMKRILDGDSNAVLLLKELPMTDQVGKLVIKRMKKTLSPQDFSRLVFLPPLSDDDYLNMYGAVDVVLDSFPFGGHTSSMDAFSAGGNPVVTLPTKLMSGRCTQGFYKHMGIQDLIANDLDEYVGIALRLGQDVAYREETRRKIRERLPSLVRDTTSARAWGDMLVTLVRGSEAQKKQLLWDKGARMVGA